MNLHIEIIYVFRHFMRLASHVAQGLVHWGFIAIICTFVYFTIVLTHRNTLQYTCKPKNYIGYLM